MSDWYDKKGKPLLTADLDTESELWHEQMRGVEKLLIDPEYKVVKQDFTPGNKYWVSTVWLGLDHSFSRVEHKPIIFETVVFKGEVNKDGFRDSITQKRYHTEKQALAGHKKLLAKYTKKETE